LSTTNGKDKREDDENPNIINKMNEETFTSTWEQNKINEDRRCWWKNDLSLKSTLNDSMTMIK